MVALESLVENVSVGLIVIEGLGNGLGKETERGHQKELGRLGSAPRGGVP